MSSCLKDIETDVTKLLPFTFPLKISFINLVYFAFLVQGCWPLESQEFTILICFLERPKIPIFNWLPEYKHLLYLIIILWAMVDES